MSGVAAGASAGGRPLVRISAHANVAVNRMDSTFVMLEPARNPAVVTACAPSALAEAVGAVPTLRARALRYCWGVPRTLNAIATSVHVSVRPAMRGGMRTRLCACPVQSDQYGCGGESDRRRDRHSDGKNRLEHDLLSRRNDSQPATFRAGRRLAKLPPRGASQQGLRQGRTSALELSDGTRAEAVVDSVRPAEAIIKGRMDSPITGCGPSLPELRFPQESRNGRAGKAQL